MFAPGRHTGCTGLTIACAAAPTAAPASPQIGGEPMSATVWRGTKHQLDAVFYFGSVESSSRFRLRRFDCHD